MGEFVCARGADAVHTHKAHSETDKQAGGCASGVVVVKLFTAHVIRRMQQGGGGCEVADVGVGSPAALVEEEGEYVEIGEKM